MFYKVKDSDKARMFSTQVSTLFNYLNTDNSCRKVVIPDMGGMYIVELRNIVRCEANGSYTKFVLENGEEYISSRSLKQYEDIFNELRFLRVQRAHLINVDHVKRFLKDEGGHIVMSNGHQVELARRKRAEFLEML